MPLRLERFGTDAADIPVPADAGDEDARLAAYEQGYTAGWEDAGAARQDERSQTEDAVARSLQTLSFTLAEARTQVLLSLRPLLDAIVAQLLPVLAQAAIGPVVRDALMPLAEEMADTPATLHLNPASRAAVEALLPPPSALPVTVLEDPALTPGQVVLSFGAAGARVDLDAASAAIDKAIRDYFDLLPSERHHG